MSEYYTIKYSSIFNPTADVDLGTNTNQFGNVFIENNLTVGETTVDETTLNFPRIGTIAYVGDNTAADIAGGEIITINGSGFKSGATVVIDGTTVAVVTVLSPTQLTFISPAKSAGTYTLYVINTDGGTAISLIGIQYSGVPTWTTSAGSLGSVYETQNFNTTVSATGNDVPITYSVGTGTLPGGITLNESTGQITGTANVVAGSTTYNFTLKASDYESQDTSRSFSITVNPDVISWSSPANEATVTQYETYAVSQALSASSQLGYGITYTANSLPTGLSISGNTITGNLSTGSGTSTSLITATSATTNKTANINLIFVRNPDVVTWSSPANNTTISQYEFSSVSQALSASSLLGYSVSYSANSLPTGITISGSNITGTLPSTATTANSTSLITATSSTTNRTATRNINFSILPDVVTWNSPANGTTYNATTNDSASIALSASSAAGRSISYSATGLPSGLSISGSNITGTYTGSGSSTATITATAATTGKTATRTLNFNVAAPFNISYLTNKDGGYYNNFDLITVSHPAGVVAGDLMILWHMWHSSSGLNGTAQAPSGFNLVNAFGWNADGGVSNPNQGQTTSFRVLPNTNTFTLPQVNGNYPQWQGWSAFYFRPTQAISSASAAGFSSNVWYQTGSVTVNSNGVAGPVIVFGAVSSNGGHVVDPLNLSASPALDSKLTHGVNNENIAYQMGYKLYGAGSTAQNHTVTNIDSPLGGAWKGTTGWYLTVR